ncbi:MAG: hypothetical protein Ta2E_07900 [Mycoplasmoidaceae bacterium]|nr:MAG: hypothetical protein Ta2E_07900 [Mycoplasmoidaceae bacterium]
MKNNLKENTKLRCKDSPRKKDIGEFFEFDNIIDREKVHKKMKQNVRQKNSTKAPEWFMAYADKQEKFNENILARLDRIENKVETVIKLNNLKTE